MALLFAAPFLLLGCVAFLLCAFLKPLRRFTLSAALFFVALGPLTLAVLLGDGIMQEVWRRLHMPGVGAVAGGVGWKTLSLVATIVVPCSAALVLAHGWITRRMTLALFRVYVGVVATCVALCCAAFVVFGVGVMGAEYGRNTLIVAGFALLLWVVAMVWFCVRRVEGFRSTRPEKWQPISIDEY